MNPEERGQLIRPENLAPILGVLLTIVEGFEKLVQFFRTPKGWICLFLTVVAVLLGYWWYSSGSALAGVLLFVCIALEVLVYLLTETGKNFDY